MLAGSRILHTLVPFHGVRIGRILNPCRRLAVGCESEGKKKPLIRIPIEAVGLPCRKHEERRTHDAFPLQGVVLRKFLRFYRRLRCSFTNVRGVEREVGFHTSLVAPSQFLGLSCFRPRQNIPRTKTELGYQIRFSDSREKEGRKEGRRNRPVEKQVATPPRKRNEE